MCATLRNSEASATRVTRASRVASGASSRGSNGRLGGGGRVGSSIVRRALRLNQNGKHPLYLFTLTGAEILAISAISRISRNDAGKLLGYQRPEVRRHIHEIARYLNSKEVLFPNSIILALSSRVRFKSSRGPRTDDGLAKAGSLIIPMAKYGEPKPAWIVDGQQRVMALAKCKTPDLPIPISAFVADDLELQRDQFLRINSAKPLPRGLITELLPEDSYPLPATLAARKIPASLCDVLHRDKKSPFYGIVRRPSTPPKDRKRMVVTDTPLIQMLQDSLNSPSGCLYPYRNFATGEVDAEGMRAILLAYWGAVKNVFPDAWGKTPEASRLMHGAGIRAMGKLMDHVMPVVNARSTRAQRDVERELRRIASLCRWTAGTWEELGGLGWNEIQNLPKHIRLLSNFLVRRYVEEKGKSQ